MASARHLLSHVCLWFAIAQRKETVVVPLAAPCTANWKRFVLPLRTPADATFLLILLYYLL